MNKKEKREWLVKYVKRNELDYILKEQYRKKKCNFFKLYSDEIQSICSIISITIISILTIILAIKANDIANKQTEIMRSGQKPIIEISVEENVNDGVDKLTIVNNGTGALQYNIEAIAYFDVLCNENNFGNIPIRCYFMLEEMQYLNNASKEIATFSAYNDNYSKIQILNNNISGIIRNYTNLYWDFLFTYYVKVVYTDIMEETHVDYFIYNRNGLRRIKNKLGEEIYNEYTYMIDNKDGTSTSNESFFDLDSEAKTLFRYILSKVRRKGLYCVDFLTDNRVLYGEYEID